jgi:hypothetical protein
VSVQAATRSLKTPNGSCCLYQLTVFKKKPIKYL